MIDINVRSDVRALSRSLTDLALKQVPFATAKALNSVANRVKAAEVDNIKQTFKQPSRFTQNSVAERRANKTKLQAEVYIKPLAARYLLPYEVGGDHVLNGRALLNPKGVPLNQYGQLSRGTLARLKRMPSVFIGAVTFRHGQTVNGVWQRPFIRADTKFRGNSDVAKRTNTTGRLKLLIRFGDALPVKKELNYGRTAQQVIDRYLKVDFDAALDEAVRTAK